MKISFFYIPIGSAEEANALGKLVVENRLAACSNIFPIQSMYPWEGQLQEDHEFVLILKTFPALNAELQAFIEQHHTYKIPCILRWDAEVNDAYGNWMENIITTI
jgi:periplasmic divalent cation tolerance protein